VCTWGSTPGPPAERPDRGDLGVSTGYGAVCALGSRLSFFQLFGALFGFVLSRARVTDYDAMAAMFRLADFHVVGVIGSAIATTTRLRAARP
jgi:hypothetical protein